MASNTGNKPAPRIITVKDLLLKKNLKIPEYQRPYKWLIKNVNQLINDIIDNIKKSAYRLGTLVIHNEKNTTEFNIVDGQQRTITLALIAYALVEKKKDILLKINPEENWLAYQNICSDFCFSNVITKANLQNNYFEIKRRVMEFNEEIITFFFNKCELVEVVQENVSEAFQFFDSQNARGKDLKPHDLLKAYHLREMNDYTGETERRETVKFWQDQNEEELAKLFSDYLFRIKNWSKGYSARYFTKDDIDVFKGINPYIKNSYPYFNIFSPLITKKIDFPFQIDQITINGEYFFDMVKYYKKMLDDLKQNEHELIKMIKESSFFRKDSYKYIRNLFYCGLLYYTDKFGLNDFDKAVKKIFIWAFSLRLKMQRVLIASIDSYALSIEPHINIQLFRKIRDAIHHKEILNLEIETIKKVNFEDSEKLKEIFIEEGYLNA
ncbi:MAG: DUF262 domain-containing protein [Treponema sp.]|nr:DUF262 domain-containing protein [Treponema sp.]MCL2250630.1 DUF262 domain-containing protein [Treponema sp.]